MEKQKPDKQDYRSICVVLGPVLTYCLSYLYYGYTVVYFNTVDYPVLEEVYGLHVIDRGVGEGLLSGCTALGAIFGSMGQQLVMSRFGRRYCFYFANSIAILGGILMLTPNLYTLFIGRIIQGIVVGIIAGIASIMIKEFSPTSISGSMGSLQGLFVGLGILIAFFLSYIFSLFMSPYSYYIIVFGFILVVTISQQLLLMFVYTNETPKYLLLKGRDGQALDLIAKIYNEEFQDNVYHQKLKDLEADNDKLGQHERELPKNSPKAIFQAYFIGVMQQLSGINIIVVYSGSLSKSFFSSKTKEVPLLINLVRIMFSFVGVGLIRKFGRKTLVQAGTFAIFISHLCISLGFFVNQSKDQADQGWEDVIILLSFVCILLAFMTTLGPIMWMYIAEIVQPNVIAPINVSHWTASWLMIALFPVIREAYGEESYPYVFLGCAALMGIALVVNHIFMVETKGKTELQIREEYESLETPCC